MTFETTYEKGRQSIMKTHRWIFCLGSAALCSALAHAQEAPRVVVSLTTVNQELSQGVDLSLQLLGFERGQASDEAHPLHGFWADLVARAGRKGTLSEGAERGYGLDSIRIRVPAWPEGTPLADAQSPKAWRDMVKDATTVSRSFSRASTGGEWDFLRFHWKGGADFLRKVSLCATLPYLSELKGAVKVPPFVAAMQKQACKATPADVPLTFSANDWGTDDDQPPSIGDEPATPGQVLVDERFAPDFLSLRLPFEQICSEESVRVHIDDLVAAQWVSPVRPGSGPAEIANAAAECSRTVATRIFTRIGESLQGYAAAGTFRGATPWLHAKLADLARAHPEKWQSGKKIAEQILAETLQAADAGNGFTRTRFVPERDLNIPGAMAQAQQGADSLQILGTLMAPASEAAARSPWRQELEAMPKEDQKAYLSLVLDGLVTSRCTDASGNPGVVTMNCLAASLGSIREENRPMFEFRLDGEVKERRHGIVAP